jgi:phosphoribosylaminoimidazolecarboxamide formyltransferase/IMP cyclohydrolase
VLRYGENPHQQAALYATRRAAGLAQAEQLHGKEMSYNNYVDADAAWRAAHDFTPSRASRSSSTPTRAASRSARTSPRRTARRTRATRCRRSAA